MKAFALVRSADPSGVSGVGIVAWGVVFPDGKAVTQWTGATTGIRQIMIWDSVADIEAIHGHNGSTRVVYVRTVCEACPLVERGNPGM